MTISRALIQPGLSVALVGTLAFTPVLMSPPVPPAGGVAIAHVSAPALTLTAAVKPRDVDKLIANLGDELEAASATVTHVVAAPGQTLLDALDSAVDLNNSLWKKLLAATDNAYLRQVLAALKTSSSSGLHALIGTVKDANSTITLTTGQLGDLLSSVITGSLSTALHAVATLLNDPLALSSYTGLVGVPLRIAGLAGTDLVAAVGDLGVNALSLTSTLVTGVTAQIDNALKAFDGVVDATKHLVGVDLINGALTAVQGIVAAPVTAVLAAVDGGVPALTGALGAAVSRIAGGVGDVIGTWLGDSDDAGAVDRVLGVVGAAPLNPATYTRALGILVGAGVATGTEVAHTVSSLASIPFTTAAKLTTTGASVIASLSTATAKVASGLLQVVGLPSYVHNLPYTVASAVNAAVKTAAAVTAAALNTIGTALNVSTAVTGVLTRTSARLVAVPAAAAAKATTVAVHNGGAATSDGDAGAPGDGTAAVPAPAAQAAAVTSSTAKTAANETTLAAADDAADDAHDGDAEKSGENAPSASSGGSKAARAESRSVGPVDKPTEKGAAAGTRPSGSKVDEAARGTSVPAVKAATAKDDTKAGSAQDSGSGKRETRDGATPGGSTPKHAAGAIGGRESVHSITARVKREASGSRSGGRS